MSIEFRKATAADIDRIGEIYEAIHTESECGRTYTGWVRGVYPIKGTAAAALGRGDLFAEESDGKVVGAAIINRTQVNVYADTPWEVPGTRRQGDGAAHPCDNPYVKGCGLGRAFVEFYENYARENGCISLRLDTNVLNLNARSFYGKLGYKEVAVLPCVFNGIEGVRLVMLEKKL